MKKLAQIKQESLNENQTVSNTTAVKGGGVGTPSTDKRKPLQPTNTSFLFLKN